MADLYVRGEVEMSSQKEQLRAFHKAGILSDEEYLAALNGEGEEQLIVAADGSGDLSDLEEALELAPAGATISIKAGVYRCSATLKKDLRLIAQGGGGVVLMPQEPEVIYARNRALFDEYFELYDEIASQAKEGEAQKRHR